MSDASSLKLQSDTLKLIQETAVKAAAAKGSVEIVALPDCERGERYLLVERTQNGPVCELKTAPPPNRRHKLLSLEQLPPYLDYAQEQLAARPVVWYSGDGVTVTLNDGPDSFRKDQVHVPLSATEEFQWLVEAAEGSEEMTQKDLVKLLRSTLAPCMTPSSLHLLKVARDLSSRTSTTAGGRIDNTRESLGRDIEAEVRSDAGEIPEQIELMVRMLQDPLITMRRSIICLVDIDPRTLATTLWPRPDDLRAARDETLAIVGEYLEHNCASEKWRVFLGTPEA